MKRMITALLFSCALLPSPLAASPITLTYEVTVSVRIDYFTNETTAFDKQFFMTLTFDDQPTYSWSDSGSRYLIRLGLPSFSTTPLDLVSPTVSESSMDGYVWEERTLSGSYFQLQAGARWEATEILASGAARVGGVQLSIWNPTAFGGDPGPPSAQSVVEALSQDYLVFAQWGREYTADGSQTPGSAQYRGMAHLVSAPDPASTLLLLGTGLAGLAAFRRRTRR